MNLYEIDANIKNLISQIDEDGVLSDDVLDELTQLQIDEQTKLENIALFIKNLVSDVKALKEEEDVFNRRRKVKENRIKNLKDYLTGYMRINGLDKYETTRAVISFRKSERAVITDEDAVAKARPELVKHKTEISLTDVKSILKAGENIEGAKLVEVKNIQIK